MIQEEILKGISKARAHVYKVGSPTPLEAIHVPGIPSKVWVKREDMSPIKAYKWRGAFNKISQLEEQQRVRGIFAASAGNHAQGVALACSHLECRAEIYMPTSTPKVKQSEVKRLGGEWVTVHLCGDNYDEASKIAQEHAKSAEATYVHPYNDVEVISGQGTLADEIVMSGQGPFDRVYVAIGGGGLASAVSTLLKFYWPDVEIIGVEGVDQASMKAAIENGAPIGLDYIDVFCDGTAVQKVGENTHKVCSVLLDRVITVSNEEVCQAVRVFWETLRAIPEPSGAMSLAGLMKDHEEHPLGPEAKVLTILCGANMDFAQIGKISMQAGLKATEKITYRVPIPDKQGALVELLDAVPDGVGIGDMQYGQSASGTQYPVLTFSVSHQEQEAVKSAVKKRFPMAEEVKEDTAYRMIEFSRELLAKPEFLEVEFPERAGALKAFMKEISPYANLYYFNYQYSGERVGRALVGVDYLNEENAQRVKEVIDGLVPKVVRSVKKR